MHTHKRKEEKESTSLIPLLVPKEQQLEAELKQAESKAEQIIARATGDAKLIVEEARKKASSEAEAILARGEKEIEQEVNKILSNAKVEAQKLKASLSQKITEAAHAVAEFILPNGKSIR